MTGKQKQYKGLAREVEVNKVIMEATSESPGVLLRL